jgi:hypothetical protein
MEKTPNSNAPTLKLVKALRAVITLFVDPSSRYLQNKTRRMTHLKTIFRLFQFASVGERVVGHLMARPDADLYGMVPPSTPVRRGLVIWRASGTLFAANAEGLQARP